MTTKTATTKPTTSKTAAFLARALEFSGKTQREIAREAGFPKPNVISMMRKGQMKIPIDRIPALADACHVDAAYFLRLALETEHPAVYAVLVETLGQPMTANEHELLLCYRLVCGDNEIEMEPRVSTAIIDTLLGFRDDDEEGGP